MLKHIFAASLISAALSSAAFADDQPAYLVAALEVTDLNAYFENYGGPVFPMLAAAGAEVIVGSPAVSVLEGDYGATWTAIVRFPSMEALENWYGSAEYQAIAPARRALTNESSSVLFAVPAFQMPQQ